MSEHAFIRAAERAEMDRRAAYDHANAVSMQTMAPIMAAIDAQFALRQAKRDTLAALSAALDDARDDYLTDMREKADGPVCQSVRDEWADAIDNATVEAKAFVAALPANTDPDDIQNLADAEAVRRGIDAGGVFVAAAEFYAAGGR